LNIVGFQSEGGPSGAIAVMPNHFPVTSSAGLIDNSFQAFGNALNYDINNTNNSKQHDEKQYRIIR
jgi:hypothetical protein